MSNTFGISSDKEQEAYLHGSCHLLAIALHRITGRSITAALAYDWDVEQDALVHCWLDLEADDVLDASGITSTDYSLRQYPDGEDAALVTMTASELLALVEGMPIQDIRHERMAEIEQDIARASGYAKKLMTRVLTELAEDESETPERIELVKSIFAGQANQLVEQELDSAPTLTPRAQARLT